MPSKQRIAKAEKKDNVDKITQRKLTHCFYYFRLADDEWLGHSWVDVGSLLQRSNLIFDSRNYGFPKIDS